MTATFGFTCTFITRTITGTDADGNDVYGNTSVLVPGCMFAPGVTSEILGSQDTVIDQPTVYAPTGTPVNSLSAVTVPGYGTFEVDGSPDQWPPHPRTGWQPSNSVVVKLKAVTG